MSDTPGATRLAEELLGVTLNTACGCDACKRMRGRVYALAAALLDARRQALAEVQQQIAALLAPRGLVVKGTVEDILEQAMKGEDRG